MIVIAPQPYAEYRVGPTVYRADHLQIIREIEPDHTMALVSLGCILPRPVVAAHYFPAGTLSVHCFACGASIECPAEEAHWFWMMKGDTKDFYAEHGRHCQPLPPREDPLPTSDRVETSPSLMAPGVALSEMTHVVISGGEEPRMSQNLELEETPDPALAISVPPADLRPRQKAPDLLVVAPGDFGPSDQYREWDLTREGNPRGPLGPGSVWSQPIL